MSRSSIPVVFCRAHHARMSIANNSFESTTSGRVGIAVNDQAASFKNEERR